MQSMAINGCTVGWTDTGHGPATALIHAGGFGAWFDPVAARLGGRVVQLRRAGYAGGPRVGDPVTIGEHAAHAAALIEALDAEPVTVVAHSSGCVIALQLARDHAELVSRLVLSEPPLIDTLLDPADVPDVGAAIGPVIGAAVGAAAEGDVPGALNSFLTAVCGPGWEAAITAALGQGWRTPAERDAAFFFANEIPALMAWSPGDLSDITHPTLLVQGADSPAPTHRLIAGLAAALANARSVTIHGANHLLPLTHPADLVALITG